jgi:hypothetical protein
MQEAGDYCGIVSMPTGSGVDSTGASTCARELLVASVVPWAIAALWMTRFDQFHRTARASVAFVRWHFFCIVNRMQR